MDRYQAHATEEWQRDTLVIQVRRLAHNDTTNSIGQVLEDTDEVPTMLFRPLMPQQERDGIRDMTPTPGIRLPREAAIALAQEVLKATGAPSDPSETAALQEAYLLSQDRVAELEREATEHAASAYRLAMEVEHLERLVAATEAHLEREARVSTVFVRGMETAQNETEWTQHQTHRTDAMESHPSNNFPGVGDGRRVQEKVNDALARMARAAKDL